MYVCIFNDTIWLILIHIKINISLRTNTRSLYYNDSIIGGSRLFEPWEYRIILLSK